MKQSCEKLTSVIQTLQLLQKRVDFAVSSFKPEDGVLAKDEAIKILEPHLFRSFFKKETFDYLSNAFGGEEELRKNFVIFETTGKTGSEIVTELKNTMVHDVHFELASSAEFMFNSPEFKVTKSGEITPTIRFEVGTLFSDLRVHTYSEIIARANELGLEFLPHETAVDLFLAEEARPKERDYKYGVFSKPIMYYGASLRIFAVMLEEGESVLNDYQADPHTRWYAPNELVFGLRKSEV
jgi:hypothetical protein